MNCRDVQIVNKLVNEIDVALKFLKDVSAEEFKEDEMLKRAVCMTVINIGELVKNITEETRVMYKEIPWKEVAGFRDIAAHKYQTLKMDDVYKTVKEDFIPFKSALMRIIVER